MKIKISKYIMDKCLLFAGARLANSEKVYMKRAPTDKYKIHSDLLAGIIGEYGAYKYLLSIGVKVSKPDLKLYAAKQKNFNADLQGSEIKIHVKSQTSESVKRYGHSWILQKTDPMLARPNAQDYLLFTEVEGDEVNILGLVNVKEMVDNRLIGECRVPAFRQTKIALYLNQLSTIVRSNL